MGSFPYAAHFCLWASLRPGENESGCKKKDMLINFGNAYIKSALCECFWA
jgi:transposase